MFENLKIKYNIFSEAFPPDEKGERNNLLSYSSYHYLLNGISINPDNIIYKPLSKNNITEVKNLHKEWFPIDYDDEFFEEVLNDNGKTYFTIGAFYNLSCKDDTNKEIILGLAFCQYEFVIDRLNKYVDEKIINDKNSNFFDELKQFLKCQFDKCIYIMTIGVLDEFRQMHIGSNLIKYIYNIALDLDNCIGIYLHVIYYNEIAIKFYKKNKFKKVRKINNYYCLDGKDYDSFVFLRMISKKEKEEYKKNINIIKNPIKENNFFYKNIYNKKFIIKFIILIICNIINLLIEYKKDKNIINK